MDSIICTPSSFIKEKKKFCKTGIVTQKKKKLYSSYGQDSTASRPSTPYQFLVLIWSTPEEWKAESTLELEKRGPQCIYIYTYIYNIMLCYIILYYIIYYIILYYIIYKGSLGKGKVTKCWNNRTVRNMWEMELSGLWLYGQYRHFLEILNCNSQKVTYLLKCRIWGKTPSLC